MFKQLFIIFSLLLMVNVSEAANALDSIKPGEWYEIPNSKLASVAPTPMPPGSNAKNAESVMLAWSGGTYDTKRDQLIVWGGGHGNYAGNEIYVFNVNTLKWTRVNNPSTDVGGTESSGIYPDGTPRSRHTYNYIQYVPSIDRFCSFGGAGQYPTGSGTSKVHCFDFDRKVWELKNNAINAYIGNITGYDNKTGLIWMEGAGEVSFLTSWNPQTDVWTKHAYYDPSWFQYDYTGVIGNNSHFVAIGRNKVYDWDLSTPANQVKEHSTTGGSEILAKRCPGFTFHPPSGNYVAWSGGADVFSFNLNTKTFTKIPLASTNRVIPTEMEYNGTYGRFQYIPSKDAFIAVNRTTENVYIFKMGNSTTPPPDTTVVPPDTTVVPPDTTIVVVPPDTSKCVTDTIVKIVHDTTVVTKIVKDTVTLTVTKIVHDTLRTTTTIKDTTKSTIRIKEVLKLTPIFLYDTNKVLDTSISYSPGNKDTVIVVIQPPVDTTPPIIVTPPVDTTSPQTTALSRLATTVGAGEWKELETAGLSDTIFHLDVLGNIWWANKHTDWSNYLSYSPKTQEILFLGAGHLHPFGFIKYDIRQNKWSIDSNVPNCMTKSEYAGCFNHGYHHGTIDQTKSIFYYHSETNFFAFDLIARSWTQWAQNTFSVTRGSGMEWFPELNRLAWVNGGRVRLINPATQAVEEISTGLTMGDYNNTMTYDPINKKVYFGGGFGTKAFYAMGVDKNVIRLADAPTSYDCTSSNLTADAVTGEVLLLSKDNKLYIYRPGSNQWITGTPPPASLSSGEDMAVTSTTIPNLGVTFYMSPSLRKVFLYRHAATPVIIVPPVDTVPPVVTPPDTTAKILTPVKIKNSGTSKSSIPVSFGQIFKLGDLKNTETLKAFVNNVQIPSQFDIKAINADGSARHGVMSFILDSLSSNQEITVQLKSGSKVASGTVINKSQLPADFDSKLTVKINGVNYSVNLKNLLNSPSIQWLSGNVVNEFIVSGSLKDSVSNVNPHLNAIFAVRQYAKNVRVDLTLENCWTYEANPTGYVYDVTYTVGSKTIISQTGVKQPPYTRWRKVTWFENDVKTTIVQDKKYVIGTGAFPYYDISLVVNDATLNSFPTSFSLMSNGNITSYMPSTGAADGIGPLPRWASLFLVTMDDRARLNTIANGEAAGVFSVHFKDKNTNLPVTIDNYPYISVLNGNVSDTYNPTTKKYEFPPIPTVNLSPHTPDDAHQPSLAYVPYAITGDYFFLEELQYWANWNMILENPHYRKFGQGLLDHLQVRAQAWGIRTLAQAAYITPDSHSLKQYFTSKLDNNLNFISTMKNSNALGYFDTYGNPYPPYGIAPWQDHFLTFSLGYAHQLGFTSIKSYLDYKTKFPVSLLADSSFCWLHSTSYTLQVANASGVKYTTFGEMYKGNFPTASCDGLIMNGYPEVSTGYGANMQPALSVSVDLNVPNALKAWKKYETRNPKQKDYNSSPQFDVIPKVVLDSLIR